MYSEVYLCAMHPTSFSTADYFYLCAALALAINSKVLPSTLIIHCDMQYIRIVMLTAYSKTSLKLDIYLTT